MFLGILTLILFMVPQFLDRKLNVTIPPGLETVILIFIFSAEILGEINAFYVKIPIWDTILHTTNGFLMAAIGFALIDLFNRSDRFSIKMSPYFVAFFAFCFSMTVGVMWEFFEFSMDWFFGMDMQKDWIVPAINSVKLNPTGANVPIHVDVQSLFQTLLFFLHISEKEWTDSCCAVSNNLANSCSFPATRIPFPPPPADALIMTGKPISFTASKACSTV